ncbi:MAG: tRNA uridine-5-carboxymethylaminomethyl(34) synthesis GTPase MnmE [Pseudolabrys sp.]
MTAERDTIFALSSGRPPAAIAVIRISGPRAGEALKSLTGKDVPAPRHAAFVRVRDPETKAAIDEGLALFFPGPRSETGEDVVELQLHGGRAVIAAALAALGKVEALRPAEAGEFTRRAFENGKLDLTAVEGLADLVAAETEGQRAQALRQMQGWLGKRAESWRERLTRALALVEARIDFADEADVPEDLVQPALVIAHELVGEIEQALADGHRGERLREGLVVAIAGPPNAGKSTLLNRIARREAAIVSPYAGTTRDVIEVHLDLAGLPVTLLDTAGVRETDNLVEMEGVRRARERAAAADLVLWVVDARDSGFISAAAHQAEGEMARPAHLAIAEDARRADVRNPGALTVAAPETGAGSRARSSGRTKNDKNSSEEATSSPPDQGAHLIHPPMWLIRNKIDLLPDARRNESVLLSRGRRNEPIERSNDELKSIVNKTLARSNEASFARNEPQFVVSATTGEGLESLFAALAHYAEDFLAGAEPALVTRERHRRALEESLAALRRALALELAGREDLLAEELRIAARTLGRLMGRVDVEDILDMIFRDFCIGK